jgi:hypothetical protein
VKTEPATVRLLGAGRQVVVVVETAARVVADLVNLGKALLVKETAVVHPLSAPHRAAVAVLLAAVVVVSVVATMPAIKVILETVMEIRVLKTSNPATFATMRVAMSQVLAQTTKARQASAVTAVVNLTHCVPA